MQTQLGTTLVQPLLLAGTDGLCSHFHGLGRNKSWRQVWRKEAEEQLVQGKGLWERLLLEGTGGQTLLLSGAAWPGQSPC